LRLLSELKKQTVAQFGHTRMAWTAGSPDHQRFICSAAHFVFAPVFYHFSQKFGDIHA